MMYKSYPVYQDNARLFHITQIYFIIYQMKIVVGSLSERKIAMPGRVFERFIDSSAFTILGCAALSGVPETPWNEETYQGAHNRAMGSLDLVPDADYAVGLESGLTERYGRVFEEAICCVIERSSETEYLGISSGLEVPQSVLDRMKSEGHATVMAQLEREYNIQNPVPSDTWGSYTGGVLSRDVSVEEATRNALVQIFAGPDSFYKLD